MPDKKHSNRILLVPHAGPAYSKRAMQAAAACIPEGRFTKCLVISTWHGYATADQEHSFSWMRDSFKNTHIWQLLHDADVMFAKSTDVERIYLTVIKTIIEYPDVLVIFNSDLTHYGSMYNATTFGDAALVKKSYKFTWEQPLLDALVAGRSATRIR